jgi:hypothetical protein
MFSHWKFNFTKKSLLGASVLALYLTICLQSEVRSQTPVSPNGSTLAATSKATKSRTVTVLGQVFIVTKGRANVLLSLVNVAAFPENEVSRPDKLLRSIQKRKADYLNELEEMKNQDPEQYHQVLAESQAPYQLALDNWRAIKFKVGTQEESTYKLLLKQREEASFGLTHREHRIAILEKLIQESSSPEFAIDALTDPTAIAKTDANGNFKSKHAANPY